ncbi:MAG: right-handed parallel beta-helix repeat-containing protein [Candidatus Micrarchaeia archaeon]|jgi:hypothetical protein
MSSAANISRILLLVVLVQSAYAITGCTDLNVSGAYVLENSIPDTGALQCINISVSDVSLDGGGFTVDGADTATSTGIYVYNSTTTLNNITIGNVTVTDFANGIGMRSVQNSSVLDSTVASNVMSGLDANYSVGITLSGMYVDNNSASGSLVGGIHFKSVNSSSIINSRWVGNGKYGILVYPGYGINVTNNTALNIGRPCMAIWTVDQGVISYNNISNCSWQGIDISQISNYTVFGNNVTGAVLGGLALSYGSRSNLIHDNIITNSGRYGVLDSGNTGNTFENNTVYNITVSCFGSGIPGNTLETYRNNIAYDCTYGFNITNTTHSTFENNTAYRNSDYGIFLNNNATDNTLTNMRVYNQSSYVFQKATPSSPNNFTNLTLGYNATAGLIKFTSFSAATQLGLVDGTNIYLRPDWVSLNASDADASDANVSAFITINNSNCATRGVFRAEGFPSSMAGILASGALYNGTVKACSGELATFNVSGFSGYTLGQVATTLSLSIPVHPTSGEYVTVSCNASNSEVNMTIYRDGVAVANGTVQVNDTSVLFAGTYSYICNTSGSENYSSASTSGTLSNFQSSPDGSTSSMYVSVSGEEIVGSTLTITVMDGSTPVGGVEMRALYWLNGIRNAINLGSTDSHGQVEFTPTVAAEYQLEAKKSGYTEGTLSFTVEAAPPEEEPVTAAEAAQEEVPASGEEPAAPPSGDSGSTGAQPTGAEAPSVPECTLDSDCGSGFGCQGGRCVEITAQPAAEDVEVLAVGETSAQAQPQGVPWWAWLLIVIILGAGAYWYFRMRK